MPAERQGGNPAAAATVPSAPAAGAQPSPSSSGSPTASGSPGQTSRGATGVPVGTGRTAALAAAGLGVLAFLGTFFTSFDPGGLLPALLLGGGLTVGVAVLPAAPRTVLPGAVLTVTAALVSLQTLQVSDGFDIAVVVLAILAAAAAVVAALSAIGLLAGGTSAPRGAGGTVAGNSPPVFTEPTRSAPGTPPGRPGVGAGSPAEPGGTASNPFPPGEQTTQRVGRTVGPASAPQQAAGPHGGGPSGPGHGQRPWPSSSFPAVGRPGEPSADDAAARTQVVPRAQSGTAQSGAAQSGAAQSGAAQSGAAAPSEARTPASGDPSGSFPAPTTAAPLSDGRAAPTGTSGHEAPAGSSETTVERPSAASASASTVEGQRPATTMLGGESFTERAATPSSGEAAGRSTPEATTAADGSGEDTPPSGIPRPSGWGVPVDGADASPGEVDGRERRGSHEAD
jgi:hypothetical protein